MVKEIERVGIPVVHMCTITPISLTVGANRIVPAIAIPHPLGNPALSMEEEKVTIPYGIRPLVSNGDVVKAGDMLISGDTLFKGTVGRTDFPGGDMRTLNDSVCRLFDLEGDYNVYPGHDTETTLSDERKNNPYVNWSKK